MFSSFTRIDGTEAGRDVAVAGGQAHLRASSFFTVKNRKKIATGQPIPKALLPGLVKLTEGKKPDELLCPIPHNYGRDFTTDLEAAKIVYETPEGKAVVHSLRKSYTTLLQELAGASLAEAQKLSRHSSPVLTAKPSERFSGRACTMNSSLPGFS